MKAETFLSNINQERSVSGENVKCSDLDCCVFWSEWSDMKYSDHQELQRQGISTGYNLIARIEELMLRKEDFGGLLFDPRTSLIIKLDNDAYKFIISLKDDGDHNAVISRLPAEQQQAATALLQELSNYPFWGE